MKKWRVEVIGFSEVEREEYLADCVICDTHAEAIQVKNKMMGPGGIWSECDVYASIKEMEVETMENNGENCPYSDENLREGK